MNRRHLLLAGLLLLGGCATTAVYSAPEAGMVELEPLLGVWAGDQAIIVRLASGGCTEKAQLAWFVEHRDGRYAVAFGRRRLDRCGGPASPVDLTFTFAELGLPRNARVAVVNPIAAAP